MSDKGRRGMLFEANRRKYWSNRSDVIDVYRDTYGSTDLAVIFKKLAGRENKILAIEAKENGNLKHKHHRRLEDFLTNKPDNVELRIEFLKDMDKSRGNSNTTYTTIDTIDDFDRHEEKVDGFRKEG